MKIHDVEQGSSAWLEARCGIVTASEADALISPLGKVRTGAGVFTYLCQKLAERWLQKPLENYDAFAMEQGRILEERARPWLAMKLDCDIQRPGFITNDEETCGCSPDGMISNETGIEIKCPMAKTHVGYLIDGCLPSEYVAQVQTSLFVTRLSQWYFLSYHKDFPKLLLTIHPDVEYHDKLAEALEEFNERLEVGWQRLLDANGGSPPPKRVPMTFSDEVQRGKAYADLNEVLQ
ncbi:MAG TPA: YqaJ viral recombinase family protein [Candidatus Limnocylindrales bacterium]|nr:YqaJ viral recombinase family protein [Candidatus Limnocylindrales bacterium]